MASDDLDGFIAHMSRLSTVASNYDTFRHSEANLDSLQLPSHWAEDPKADWLLLPREVLTVILLTLGPVEIIKSAQKVCTLWRSVCIDPSIWTRIEMRNLGRDHCLYDNLHRIRSNAIDLSRGGCVDIAIEDFGDDELLNYIVERGCKLRCLRLVDCWSVSDKGMAEAARGLQFLETFVYYTGRLENKALESIGKNCPLLRTLIYDHQGVRWHDCQLDDEALAIADNMPGLRHLSLFGNCLTNKGLRAILKGCPHLEWLNLRECFNVDLGDSDLAKGCERIKDLKLSMASALPPEEEPYLEDDYSDLDGEEFTQTVFSMWID